MSLNRGCFSILMGVYFSLVVPDGTIAALVEMAVGLTITAGIFAHIVLGPDRSRWRRVIALFADLTTICVMMQLGGAHTACFYPLLLWTVLGNGFRFGRRSLLWAAMIGTVGFSAVALTTPFWLDSPALAAGLALGLAVLPLYTLALLNRLHAAKRQAEAASEAKTFFLARVSHELRTPLHAIIGMGSLLERSELPPQTAEMVGTIMTASRSLLDLINDLLQLSVAETGAVAPESADFDLLPLLRDVQGLVQPQAREKGLRVALHVGPRTPARLRGDARRIGEVLLNLAGNALKFTEHGGILIAARAIDQSDGGGSGSGQMRIRIEVADTGIGIAPSALDRVFQTFTQADPAIAQRYGGTGLGLAICKRAVEALGGTIGVDSRLGGGSTFWFEVPVECALDGAALPGAAVETASPSLIERPLTILSIESSMHGRLRDVVHAWSLDATLVECRAAAVPYQLGAAAAAGHRVLVCRPASPAAADALDAAVRAMPESDVPPLVLVGALTTAAGAGHPDLRWVAPTWLDEEFGQEDLRAALLVATNVLRTAPARTIEGGEAAATSRDAGGAAAHRPARQRERRRLSILVADDNRTNQKVMAKILEAGGHGCTIVGDGEAALDALVEGGFDLVLMDVNMPGMDGIEATKLHRVEALGQPRIPIIALTADATPATAERCREAGMDGCIVKPVRADLLLDAIEAAVPAAMPDAPSPPPPARVSPPSLRLVQAPVLDQDRLKSLHAVGGAEFVGDLIKQFLDEARELFARIDAAFVADDVPAVKALAHALGSSASNIGASRLGQLSLTLERTRTGELRLQGHRRLHEIEDAIKQLEAEWSEARKRVRA